MVSLVDGSKATTPPLLADGVAASCRHPRNAGSAGNPTLSAGKNDRRDYRKYRKFPKRVRKAIPTLRQMCPRRSRFARDDGVDGPHPASVCHTGSG